MKRAQVQGQPLIYLLSMIIMIMILIFGYQAINDMMQKQDEIAYLKFESRITGEIEKISRQYGSVKELNLDVPGDYDKVCFIDLSKPPHIDLQNNEYVKQPLIYDSWSVNAKRNAFLINEIPERMIYVGDIEIDNSAAQNGYVCFDIVKGNLDFKIKGLGDKTLISPVQ